MHHLWSKIYSDNAISSQYTLRMDGLAEWNDEVFLHALQECCRILDIVTPVILTKHYKELNRYHKTRFSERDFIEPIEFDYLEVQHFFLK